MADDAMVTIEVDGRTLQARHGAMLIEVTDDAGIPIPRFCYHKKLSIAANCRMCLVEVANVPKPLPACATPVSDGMKVYTRSPAARAAQQDTMEFLLINHPLDCPICDQGGECELQDVAMGFGGDLSRYSEGKRVVLDQDLGPLIATDMTRCIHCTRCVRFGAEIAGTRELGALGRGEHMHIGTFLDRSVDHELAGNVIDLCPVGALTSKPFRYAARAWELVQRDGIAAHDSVGSNLHLHVRGRRVMRVHPRDNEAVNETWISDRDRFSYQGLYSDDRLPRPMVKEAGQWRETDWQEALQRAAGGLGGIAREDPDQLAALLSPAATLEEMYLAQRLIRGLGGVHVDHRLRQADFRGDMVDPLLPWLGTTIADLETQQALLVIGSNIRSEQPLLAHRMRKAAMNGAVVGLVNPLRLGLTFEAQQFVVSPSGMLEELAAIARALGVKAAAVREWVNGATPEAHHQALARHLKRADKGLVLFGGLAAGHPDYAALRALGYAIARTSKSAVGYLPEAANSVGGWLAGATPLTLPGARPADSPGEPAGTLLADGRKGFLLLGVEPAFDLQDPATALAALERAECVVALSPFRSESLAAVADVMLPMAGYAETSGTFVNAEARWQSFAGAVPPPGESRPAWKVLRVLGNLLGLDGFEYTSSEQVRQELAAQCGGCTPDNGLRGELPAEATAPAPGAGLARIGDIPIYAQDALVRRAPALQRTPAASGFGVWLHPAQAEQAGLAGTSTVTIRQNGGSVRAPLTMDPDIPPGCARIPAGVPGSEALGPRFGQVTLEKA